MTQKQAKPTFQQLLAQHGLTYNQFYLACEGIPSEEIQILYERHLATMGGLQKILGKLNELTGKEYTADDIYTRYVY